MRSFIPIGATVVSGIVGSEAAESVPPRNARRRFLLALVPPLVALGIQLVLGPIYRPYVWFLFFPAVFLSSWIGGLGAGILASALSAASVILVLIPPERSFVAPSGQYIPASVLFITGVVFGVFHDRLRKANLQSARALVVAERAIADLRRVSSERRAFAALVENSSDFIGIASPEGKLVYVNPAGRRIVGLAPDYPIETTTIAEYYASDQRAFASDVIVQSMVERGHWEGESALRHWQTQEAIPVSDTHFIIPDPETGQPLGIGTVTRDISERDHARDEAEQARRQLQEANEAKAALIEQAPDAIFLANLDGRYTDVNSAGCRMLGYTREEIIGKTIVDLIGAEQADRLECEKQLLLAGQPLVSEWSLQRKDGTYVPVEVSARILSDGRWQGLVRDISARTELEHALRASHEDLKSAQSVASVGSWRLDVRRDELKWSDENYRIFGLPLGTPITFGAFLACVHPDDRAYVEEAWSAALRGQPYDIEHRIIAGGRTKWVRSKADLEFDEHRGLVGGIGITHDITDRKQHEEELRETRERLELALRGADLGTWDWDIVSGDVVYNPRWAEMRGYRLEELAGRVETWLEGLHPADMPRVQRVLDDYFQGRRPDYECEHRVRTKSGQWIWILDRGKVFVRDEKGAPIRMVGTELDITARKRAEEELRIAEAKASGIVTVSADAIISIDEEQRITLFNEGAEKIFGYSRAEAIGAPLAMLLPERLRTFHARQISNFSAGEAVARRMGERGEVIFGRRKNGEEFPADAAISKLNVDGTLILTLALRDVTEQRRLEHEQQFLAEVGSVLATTLELPAILTSIGELATRTLADACIVYVVEPSGEVRRLKALVRDPDQAWIADAFLQSPFDRSRMADIWSELEANRSVLLEHVSAETVAAFSQSEEHLRALRALDPRSLIVAPLFAHQKLVGAMSLISSASGRVYSSAEVRLVEQVAQRAGYAIDNAQLYEEARRAIEARDNVLRVVAHDLRNPLGTILMQAEVLRAQEGEPRTRRQADSIERSVRRMTRLIEDLVDVARMDEGQLSVTQTRVSVDQAVHDAVEAQESLAAAAELELQVELAPDLPEVWVDRDRLLQIFENLLGNALKFTQAGGVITVGAAPRAGDVLFWVEDTGAGIAVEDVPHVFDRFWQARRDERRGAGLGLAIVKGLVEAHGGRIWLESTLGRGTSFFFTIPAAPRPEQWAPEPSPAGP